MATNRGAVGFDDAAYSGFGMLPDPEIATGQVPQAGVTFPDHENLASGDDNGDESAGEQIWGGHAHLDGACPSMIASVDVRPRRVSVRS
jgi:hypothetical protein